MTTTAKLSAETIDISPPGNAYRLYVSIDEPTGVIDAAKDQLSAWLREKGWDTPLEDGFLSQNGRELTVLHRESSDGAEFRARLLEPSERGDWQTELTVHEPRQGNAPWIALEVVNSQGHWVAVPRLADRLLDVLPAMDGDTRLSTEPRVIGPAGVDDLLEQICDLDRQGLYFVAGSSSDDIDFTRFTEQVERWGRQVRGLAQTIVLTPEATDAVREGLGPNHAVNPWTIRTFYPDVDPAISSDAFRHRYLTVRRLVDESDEAIRKLLGRIARRHAFTRTPPHGYVRIDRALRRLEDKVLVQTISGFGELNTPAASVDGPDAVTPIAVDHVETLPEPAGTSAPGKDYLDDGIAQTEGYLALIDMVKRVLGVDDVTEGTLAEIAASARRAHAVTTSIDRISQQLAERQQQLDELHDDLAAYVESVDDLQLEVRIAADDARRLADENRWLRQRLGTSGDREAYSPTPDSFLTSYPDSFAELYERRHELQEVGVVLTVDARSLRVLDEHDTVGNVARTAWECLLALADYLRARRDGVIEANVTTYLRKTPHGYRSVPPKKFAEKETATTMKAWGDERSFPVPVDVDPSGEVKMEAHFKLGKLGMVSPRLYYLDCFSTTGKVYVGYIGTHLRNTKTS